MNNNCTSVLIAEPSEDCANILREQLEGEYDIRVVSNGQECLASVAENIPDFVILEARLPDVDGLDICKQLRASNENSFIPIIFISETDNVADLLAGYQAGGDEFITKPFDRQILLSKVKLLLKYKHQHNQLSEQSQGYLNAAMEALTGSGEMGVIIMFLQNSYHCHDYESLGRVFFEALSNYDLTATLMTRGNGDTLFQTTEGEIREIENTILSNAVEEDRIVELNNRAIYNGGNCSFLIRNMPVNDESRLGRLRDHLATMLVGLDARIKGIDIEETLREKQHMIREVVSDTHSALASLDVINKQQRNDQAAVLNDLGKSIEASFISLGLNDNQEAFLTGAIEEAEMISDALYESGTDLDSQFESIIQRLTTAIELGLVLDDQNDTVAEPVTSAPNDSGTVFF